MGLVLAGVFLHVPPTYPKPPLPPIGPARDTSLAAHLDPRADHVRCTARSKARHNSPRRDVTSALTVAGPNILLALYVYSTERAESKSSHAYYLKVYARYHYP